MGVVPVTILVFLRGGATIVQLTNAQYQSASSKLFI